MQAELGKIEQAVVAGTRGTGRGLRTGLATAGNRWRTAGAL
jgi:hypothetical protein